MSDEWGLIESDPGVFWDIANTLGVKGIQFEEVVALDEDELLRLQSEYGSIFGLIFLFRWHPSLAGRLSGYGEVLHDSPVGLFFARQMVKNSCGTQAMLSVLMNLKPEQVVLGDELRNFKNFVSQFNSELIGETLGTQESIRAAHNKLKTQSFITIDDDATSDEKHSDPFHYITYVPVGSHVYSLDGLRPGPVRLPHMIDPSQEGTWWKSAIPAMRQIIQQLQTLPSHDNSTGDEIRFNLIAVLPDRLNKIDRQCLDATEAERAKLEACRVEELDKRKSWTEENALRQHDLTPFLLGCLKHLARLGKLSEAYKESYASARKAKASEQKSEQKSEPKFEEPSSE